MKRKIINGIAMMSMMLMMCTNYVMASTGNGSVTVGTGSVFITGASAVERTTNYDYVQVKANSVYPTGSYSSDNFTKCKTAIYRNDNTSTRISNVYTLTEGNGYSNVKINNGYLSLKKVNICFAGNDPDYGAVVAFSYNGK
ncbi:MAG: hypothetical protein ACI39Q_05470 [Wujia sp.]